MNGREKGFKSEKNINPIEGNSLATKIKILPTMTKTKQEIERNFVLGDNMPRLESTMITKATIILFQNCENTPEKIVNPEIGLV